MPPARGFEADDVWRLAAVSDPRLSPEGDRVAYVVGVPDRDTDRVATSIWVAPADGSAPPRRWTEGPKDSAPRWSPDDRWLAWLSDGGAGAQLHVSALDGGQARALTEAPSGVTSPAWSPDGRAIAYSAKTGEWTEPDDRTAVQRSAPRVLTGLRNRYDAVGWFDGRRSHLWVVGVDGGPPRQVTDGDWDDEEPAWSPDGALLAFVSDRRAERADRTGRDVWVTAVTGRRRPRRLTAGRGNAAQPSWAPVGGAVAYVGHELDDGDSAGHAHLMLVDAGGATPPRSLTAALDRYVYGMLRPPGAAHAWVEGGAALLFLAVDRGTIGVYRTTLGRPSPTPVVTGDRQVTCLDAAGGTVAFVSQWPSAPPEVSCVAVDGGGERLVSDANAGLRRAVRFRPVRRRTHRSADGLDVDVFVIAPAGRASGPRPAVLEIHGGPHSWHPQASMLPLYQALAAAGYVVVLVNPRGSHGYGEAFARACVEDWGGADFGDLMGVLDDLGEAGVVDPDRLYVAGYSYGGFMTSWTVGHTGRFRAACVSAPVVDHVSMWGTTDIPAFSERELGGDPWSRPDLYRDRSPISYLPEVTTPVMLLHWDGDLRCPVSQSDQMFQGLRRLGKEVVLVRYPGGYHVVRTPSQMADFVGRHFDWFASH